MHSAIPVAFRLPVEETVVSFEISAYTGCKSLLRYTASVDLDQRMPASDPKHYGSHSIKEISHRPGDIIASAPCEAATVLTLVTLMRGLSGPKHLNSPLRRR